MPYEGEIVVNDLPAGGTPALADKVMMIDNATGELRLFTAEALGSVVPVRDGITDEIKQALLQLAQKVAYVDANGEDYYDDLYHALYPGNLVAISAVYDSTHQALVGDSLDSLKPYLTVTAVYDDSSTMIVTNYTLSGSLSVAGSNIITVTYTEGDQTEISQVSVTALGVVSISAVFTQGQATIYTNDSLDTLRQYLVVTANYSDSSTQILNDDAYDLSGALSEGTQTITVSYGDKSDTFTVVCTVNGWLYHFEQSILSSGAKDFGFSGPSNFDAGYNGSGYSYCHLVTVDGDTSTDQGSIKSTSLTDTPNLDDDFTIAGWCKCGLASTFSFAVINNVRYNTSASETGVTNAISSVQGLASGWTFSAGSAMSARYKSVRLQSLSGNMAVDLFAKDGTNRASVRLTPPSSFDIKAWHHYAVTRKDGLVRVFVDGQIICYYSYSKPVFFNTQVTTAASFTTNASTPSNLVAYAHSMCVDDLFVAEYCKWEAAFNASAIAY